MIFIYILQSLKTKGFYIGQTEDVERRVKWHNSNENTQYTLRDQPWQLMKVFSCNCRHQARKIEMHIKKMKSRRYVENLLLIEEIFEKLKHKYACVDC